MIKTAYVYILASKKHGTLYTGVTTNLIRRIYEHKHHLQQGFTRKYNVTRLVWYEQGEELSLKSCSRKKRRNRQWKIEPDRTRQSKLARPFRRLDGFCDSAKLRAE